METILDDFFQEERTSQAKFKTQKSCRKTFIKK